MLPNSYNNVQNILTEIASIEESESLKEPKWKELKFDFDKGQFVYAGADQIKLSSKKDVVKQWIKKLFFTEKEKWDCYLKDNSYSFGLLLHKYIGQQLYPNNFLIELIKDDIYKSLIAHENIKDILYLQLVQVDDILYCGFIVELDDGTGFEVDEVIKI